MYKGIKIIKQTFNLIDVPKCKFFHELKNFEIS